MDEARGAGPRIVEFLNADMTESRLRQTVKLGFQTMMRTPLCDEDPFRWTLQRAGVDYPNLDNPETASALHRDMQGV